MNRSAGARALVLLMAPCMTTLALCAETYPLKPVRLLVPTAPGGGGDITAREIAPRLGELWGQQVVIDNRPGASGIIAAELVAKSQPDGYTLLISGSSISIVRSLYPSTFDVQRDLEPLALVSTTPSVWVAHPSLGVTPLQVLASYA